MRSDDRPNPIDLFKLQIQNDVRAYATLLIVSGLCRQMHKNGDLTDDDVDKVFDSEESEKLVPASHRDAMRELIQTLRKYCLGQVAQPSSLQ